MPHFAYIAGGWVQKDGKMCLRNKSMAPNVEKCGKLNVDTYVLLKMSWMVFKKNSPSYFMHLQSPCANRFA